MARSRGVKEFYGLLRNILASVIIFTFVASAFAKEEFATSWKSLNGYSKLIWDIKYSPKGNYFALTISDNTVELFDKDWKKLWGFQENLPYPGSVAFMPDEKSLILSKNHKDNSEICVIRLADHKITQTVKNEKSHINAISVSPDGSFLASASSDKTVKI